MKLVKTEFYLVRHGQTPYNIILKLQGRVDIGLSELGLRQTSDVAEYLKDVDFVAAYTSPLSRAQITAKTVIGDRDIPLYIDEDIIERSYGNREGTIPTVEERKTFFERDLHDIGGESYEDVYNRASSVLLKLAEKYPDQRVLITTHGDWIMSLLRRIRPNWLEGYKRFGKQMIPNCSTTILEVEDNQIKIKSLPDAAYVKELWKQLFM